MTHNSHSVSDTSMLSDGKWGAEWLRRQEQHHAEQEHLASQFQVGADKKPPHLRLKLSTHYPFPLPNKHGFAG